MKYLLKRVFGARVFFVFEGVRNGDQEYVVFMTINSEHNSPKS